ncbi:MAG: cation:proton antiporter [Planctomycetota bacterium]
MLGQIGTLPPLIETGFAALLASASQPWFGVTYLLPPGGDPRGWLFIVAGTILGIAIANVTWRVIRGPSLPDRVVALDLMGVLCVAMLCVFAIAIDRPAILSVAMVAGLILFLGTAAFAVYVERRSEP